MPNLTEAHRSRLAGRGTGRQIALIPMTPTPSLRYALLGTGSVARWHLQEFSKQPATEVVGFQDVSATALARFAAETHPSVPRFSDPEELLATARPDIVSICTPNKFHHDLTLLALRHGCHVYCEKPMAMTLAEAEAMEAARAAAGRRGAINFSYRGNPGFRFARHLIATGELGRLYRVHAVYLQSHFASPAVRWAWRNDAALAGFGALGDLGVHMIDAVTFITGLSYARAVGLAQVLVPEKPDPAGVIRPVTTDTNASFLAEMQGGVVATFETSQCAPGYGNWHRIEVSGERGTLVVCSDWPDTLRLFAGAGLTAYSTWKSDLPEVHVPSGFRDALSPMGMSGFVRALRGDTGEHATFADGVAAQRVLEALGTSMKTHAWSPCA